MSRRGCRRRPNRGRCSSPRACSGRRPGFSSSRTRARMSSRACRRRSRSIASCGRAAAAGAAARAILTPLVGREDELSLLHAPLVARARRRGSVRPDRRRARHRQVAPDRGVPRKTRRDAAHLGRMGRLAAPAEHAPAPARRMGQTAFWRRRRDRRGASRRPREHFRADRPRRGRIRAPARAAGRHSAAGGPPGEIPARGIAAPATGGDDGLGSGGRAVAAGGARLRGSALGRSDLARSPARARRARRAVPFAGRRHHAAGIPSALGHALAPRRRFARAARPRAGAPHGRRDRKPACALRRDDRWSGRANRRRPAVRRGGDAAPARARRAGRRAGDPADLAAIARRAARPARRSARSRADRRGAGARFFLPAAERRVVIRRRIRRACACKPRSIGSRKPTSCSSTAPLRPPPTVSSTR